MIVQAPPAPDTSTVPVGIEPPVTVAETVLDSPRRIGPVAVSVTVDATTALATSCITAPDALPAWFASPPYVAVIECVPGVSDETVHCACPAVSGTGLHAAI